ncbi:hypothetical protein CAEBREN_10310 [Caenorhabditis brenneri]|uniref:Uncharacterized protein n=1 Tax=Caenorhabditis brenneri TaxID=135651 RepID=G0PGN8_CAEBE|nr:hypothetical protein CAEBREN_10310 [Caenorhabditis brenneri]
MDQKPVSYLALKSLLGHMEANKRIQTVIACPSLRKVEKTIPLRIDHLAFMSDYEVKINNNLYSFGVIRQYREGPPPEEIQSANGRGGLRCDLDESGYERPSYRLTKTTGDICFGDGLDDDDEFGIWLEGRIPAHNKIDLNPAYDCFVQLNLTTGGFGQPSRPVQKIPYEKKLHEVMKEFMTFIFGGRTCPVQVNCLEIYSTTQIIRLPVGVKFSVHELGVPTRISSVSEVLRPILDESCFPIKHINQRASIELNDPFVASAEEVTFEDHRDGSLFDVIRNLPHFKVNIFNCSRFNEEEFIEFLEYLLESDKKPGTTYQLAYDNERKYKNQEIASTFLRIDAGIMKREVIIDFLDFIIQKWNSLKERVRTTYDKDVKLMYFGRIKSYSVLKIQVLGNRQATNE